LIAGAVITADGILVSLNNQDTFLLLGVQDTDGLEDAIQFF
jgi:hypothetical protein